MGGGGLAAHWRIDWRIGGRLTAFFLAGGYFERDRKGIENEGSHELGGMEWDGFY